MPDLRQDLPYRTEYANTGWSRCKSCKGTIAMNSVRMGVMVQAQLFDGKVPNWHHFHCFFKRFRPKLKEIRHLTMLKYDDQNKIEEAIKKAIGLRVEANKIDKSKTLEKKTIDEIAPDVWEFSDFSIEHSKTGRAKCRLCEILIKKDEIRISKLDKESAEALKYGPINRWFHVQCFVSARDSLGFYGSADDLPFFDKISEYDQKVIIKKLVDIKKRENIENESSTAKKPKICSSDEKNLKEQSEQFVQDFIFKCYNNYCKQIRSDDQNNGHSEGHSNGHSNGQSTGCEP